MAYSELIKSFNRIRDYMREFYVYGFKRREEYTKKSPRSYDDERRRMESILGDYMRFRQTPDGKNVFLSIDSRVSCHNPLYKAWKAKSFTDGDITLHFLLLDILQANPGGIGLSDLLLGIDEKTRHGDKTFDESTVRKKLKEYAGEGIVRTEKAGKTLLYYLAKSPHIAPFRDAVDFFSEVAPCGVIGSYILDKIPSGKDVFRFKHHYITDALDSEILAALLQGIGEKRCVTLTCISRRKEKETVHDLIPLRIMRSVQSGRGYLMAYVPRSKRLQSYRIDNILSVTLGDASADFDTYREMLDRVQPHLFGVSTQSASGEFLEHVDFTVAYGDDEPFILQRLMREKRCGSVTEIDGNTARFSADVYDANELVPWIRTFICRITEIHFSNERLQRQFTDDVRAMYRLYGLAESGEK